MLLAIDIGNSNISVGLFDEKRDLKFLSSIDTDSRKTADQISIDLMNIFSLYRYDLRDVSGAIFSSVVPPINFMMAKALTRLLGKPPMIVGPGVKTGLNIRMEIHNQLGADLVAGAVAALDKYPTPIIMIDMGTATTISYISSKRSYEGGLMFPGVRLSLDALSDHTAQLPDISLQHPKSLIGKNTEDCMRSGIVYGTAGMLLAIDIGNSNISVGLFDEKRDLKFLSSIDTDSRKTADQISIDLMNIFSLYRYDLRDVSGAIFSSVVPPINFMMAKALTRLLGKPPMIVGPGVKTGLNIRMEIHNQLGADLVAGAVAALDKYPTPIIMIDMGTATTISYISSKRSYEGGLMFPGVRLSLDALSDHTAQLPDISLQHPKSLIGKNTEDCMRSGIVYGTAGMLDGVIDRIRELLPQCETPTIVATGSNAPVIVRYCRNKVLYDKYLLMEGLWDIYQKNH